jgi:stage IV sporulation protein A
VEDRKIYKDIATRTDGDIYIGVVGPVRTGKSTFIKRFMETLVIPAMGGDHRKERARDELPQSGGGRTIMTAEPKFVPEDAVQIEISGGKDAADAHMSVRLVDCVGYMVDGAIGQFEDGLPRMVHTPWFDEPISMIEAAEVGTRRVIAEHSTIGLVVTTDGTICGIDRADYEEPESRVIAELKALGKPFMVLVNSRDPGGAYCRQLCKEITERHGVTCISADCQQLAEEDITAILRSVLYEFPLSELQVFLPSWVETLPHDNPTKSSLYAAMLQNAGHGLRRVRDVEHVVAMLRGAENVSEAKVTGIDLGRGVAMAAMDLPRSLFYQILGEQSGFAVANDGDLLGLLVSLRGVKTAYDKISGALAEVRETGYGIVMPSATELKLEEPEIVRQGGRYGIRLRASAPSIHMIRADIETEVSPIVGSEKQSEELIHYLLADFDSNPGEIWQSNIFGKTLEDLVSEGLHSKLKRMPDDARGKLQETLQRIVNEGSGGLICIIL